MYKIIYFYTSVVLTVPTTTRERKAEPEAAAVSQMLEFLSPKTGGDHVTGKTLVEGVVGGPG